MTGSSRPEAFRSDGSSSSSRPVRRRRSACPEALSRAAAGRGAPGRGRGGRWGGRAGRGGGEAGLAAGGREGRGAVVWAVRAAVAARGGGAGGPGGAAGGAGRGSSEGGRAALAV